MSPASTIHVISLDADLEKQMQNALVQTKTGLELQLAPSLRTRFLLALEQGLAWCHHEGYRKVVLLVDPQIRRQLRRVIERHFPHLSVLSYAEVAPGYSINNLLSLSL